MSKLLEVKDLSVTFGEGPRAVEAVRGVSFHVERGETVALVGESGSGKSVSALSIMKLLPYPLAKHPSGSVKFKGEELMDAPDGVMRALRGSDISMVFQEPLTSLNPLHPVGNQIAEMITTHQPLTKAQVQARVEELMDVVGLSAQIPRLKNLPHEFSGGQQQRIMIAMALANEPDLLIADEPTTAVDVTIQAQLLKLLADLQKKMGLGILFITHDLGIVRRIADRAYVMQGGELVESGDTASVFDNPQHPYTQRLLASEPKGRPDPVVAGAAEVLRADDIKVWFPIQKGFIRRTVGHVKAVDGIDVSVRRGHTLGIVGESGSGKSTLARALLRLERSNGVIRFKDQEIQNLDGKALQPLRADLQIVFQDPFGSLSPRMSVAQIIGEGLLVHDPASTEKTRRQTVAEVLEEVGLSADMMDRYPHEFSGGQRQRISIARALVLKPDVIALDEPTSALDVSVQAQIVDLLRDLQKKHELTYVFISHDLKVVRALAHDVMVMQKGKVVEYGSAQHIFDNPRVAYTRALMNAAFNLDADDSGVVGI
ncbi:ABC transporter ATP-binding protein [Magnetovibrio sp. PR-2]|uniref:ABC transporter ATP-binding protein n=1 Tax=Magnetovibrio sp. PR-2 TaxID=3120356 RepID=UPI002FCE5031